MRRNGEYFMFQRDEIRLVLYHTEAFLGGLSASVVNLSFQ